MEWHKTVRKKKKKKTDVELISVSLHINLRRLFNAKAILLEEQ